MMKMISILILSLLGLSLNAQAEGDQLYEARIGVLEINSSIEITPSITNHSDRGSFLKYSLVVSKNERVVSRQAGTVYVEAGEKKGAFSKVIIGIEDGDHCDAELLVYERGELVGKCSVSYPQARSI